MHEQRRTSTSDDLTRDFSYVEPERHTALWQILRDISETIVLTLLMFLVIRLVVQDFQVDGTSMVPTFQNSQFVLIDKLSYHFVAPHRGDVIVFMPPTTSKDPYIKRIIGIPGDQVSVASDGIVRVNGVALTEPYVNDLDNPYGPESVTVGPNEYFVLGDNRGASSDSRDWGLVQRNAIIGKAVLVYWPLSSFHLLPDESSVFARVPVAPVTSALPVMPPTEPGALAILVFLPLLAAAVRYPR